MESLTKESTISLACTSTIINVFIFNLYNTFISPLIIVIKSFKSIVYFIDSFFIACLSPDLTFLNTSSTRHVHHIYVPTIATIPNFSITHFFLS